MEPSLPRSEWGSLADRLEVQLRAIGWWGSPPPSGPLDGPFGGSVVGFGGWLEHVLVPRLRAVAAGDLDPPATSQVAVAAVRELDGVDVPDELFAVLNDIDRAANASAR